MPVLRSMYTETLRFYSSLFALRSTVHGDFKFGNFTIPKDGLIARDTRVAAMNSNIWNDRQGAHPVDQFWAERFLVYPNEPKGGPLHSSPPSKPPFCPPAGESTSCFVSRDNNENAPQFTMDSLAGAWIPFGGGTHQCPGHNFAKQEVILSFAIIFSMLGVELLHADATAHVKGRKPNMIYYGLGTPSPKGKCPSNSGGRNRDLALKWSLFPSESWTSLENVTHF